MKHERKFACLTYHVIGDLWIPKQSLRLSSAGKSVPPS
jgi:hypothetical protein